MSIPLPLDSVESVTIEVSEFVLIVHLFYLTLVETLSRCARTHGSALSIKYSASLPHHRIIT